METATLCGSLEYPTTSDTQMMLPATLKCGTPGKIALLPGNVPLPCNYGWIEIRYPVLVVLV